MIVDSCYFVVVVGGGGCVCVCISFDFAALRLFIPCVFISVFNLFCVGTFPLSSSIGLDLQTDIV